MLWIDLSHPQKGVVKNYPLSTDQHKALTAFNVLLSYWTGTRLREDWKQINAVIRLRQLDSLEEIPVTEAGLTLLAKANGVSWYAPLIVGI